MALGYQDNEGNILGANTASNLYDSSNVTPDADGSILERIEYLQGQISGLTAGSAILNGTAGAATDSTTDVIIAGLTGFGNDYFNDHWYMQILVNADSAGAAPESEVRKITDYVSATGAFVCDAFSQKMGANDLILVLHESVVAIGRNDANNIFDSTTVVANANGSVLERLAYIQSLVDTEVASIKLVTDALPDAGALTSLTNALGTVDDFLDGASLEKLTGSADGTDVYPATVVNDSVIAKILSKANPAAASSYDNTSDSLEAISDKIDAVDDYIDTEISAITTKLTKPTTDLATDDTIAQVIGIKADTTGGTSLVSIGKQILAAVDAVDNYVDTEITALTTKLAKPAGDAATDATIAEVVGTKADTVGGTSLVAIGKQILAAVDAVDNYVDTEITSLGTAIDNFAAAGGDGKAVVTKDVTFANTAADVNLFTITGGVNFKLYAFCTTNVESAAGCNIGVDLGSAVVIADTDCTTLEANDVWHDNTPDASCELDSVFGRRVAYGGTIVLDVEGAKQVDSGVIKFVCVYTPLTSGAAVAAA